MNVKSDLPAPGPSLEVPFFSRRAGDSGPFLGLADLDVSTPVAVALSVAVEVALQHPGAFFELGGRHPQEPLQAAGVGRDATFVDVNLVECAAIKGVLLQGQIQRILEIIPGIHRIPNIGLVLGHYTTFGC